MNQHKSTSGSAAIAYTFNPGKSVYITEVRLHLSAAGGAVENLTITHNSALGAGFDVVHLTQAMAAVTNLVWRPEDGPLYVFKGETIEFAYANSNARDYGLEIIYR